MKISLVALFLVAIAAQQVTADTFGSGGNQFAIEFVTVGDPGNPADTTGAPNPAGSVDYVYRIGKFEISRDMFEKASEAGGLGLDMDSMDSVNGGTRPEMPAKGVSWNEAARFVNWLNTSEGFSTAYKFATQPGDMNFNPNENILLWEPTDAGFDAANRFRNSQARYFLPSADEWYKAAYYDAEARRYWDYPVGSNSEPVAVASGTDAGTAVWKQTREQGPADITLAGGLSPYGVMGLGGNVWEWEETSFDLMNDNGSSPRGKRGGNWFNSFGEPIATRRDSNPPTNEFWGFRVASHVIPEPSTLVCGLIATFAGCGYGIKRRMAVA